MVPFAAASLPTAPPHTEPVNPASEMASNVERAQAHALPAREGVDFEASIDPKQFRDLAASRRIANGENVLLLGPPGVAKTHLSIALT